MSMITPGAWARVRLHPDCPGDGRRPHHPAEEGRRVEVTTVDNDGEHSVFALFKGGVDCTSGPARTGASASGATSVPTSWSRAIRRG